MHAWLRNPTLSLQNISRDSIYSKGKKRVKQSNYRPEQSLKVPGGWGSQISWQSAHGSGKVSALRTGCLYPSPNIPGTHFSERLSRPHCHSEEGLCQCKIPMTPLGTEPATFRLVAQCLRYLRHRVPRWLYGLTEISNVYVNEQLSIGKFGP